MQPHRTRLCLSLSLLSLALFSCSISATTAPALSNDVGQKFYIDGALGDAKLELKNTDTVYDKHTQDLENFHAAVGYNLWQSNRQQLAVELGYNNLKPQHFSGSLGVSTLELFSYKITDVNTFLKYSYQLLPKLSLFGKLGIAYVTQTFSLLGNDGTRHEFQPDVALGLQYQFNNMLGLQLYGEHISGSKPAGYGAVGTATSIDDFNNHTAEHNMIWLGLNYQLGQPGTGQQKETAPNNFYVSLQQGFVGTKTKNLATRTFDKGEQAVFQSQQTSGLVQRISLAYLYPSSSVLQLGGELGLANYPRVVTNLSTLATGVDNTLVSSNRLSISLLFDAAYQFSKQWQLTTKLGISGLTPTHKFYAYSESVPRAKNTSIKTEIAPEADLGLRYHLVNKLYLTADYSRIFAKQPSMSANDSATDTINFSNATKAGTISAYWLGVSAAL